MGAIVLEVSGAGVRGFVASGQTHVFFAESETDVYRVVLVTSDPDRILFGVEMDDVRAPALTVTTVEAVDGSNMPIADVSGISVVVGQ